jgi:hypothetical protein
MRSETFAAALAALALAACGSDAADQDEPTRPALPTVGASPWRPCDKEGSRPDYFVPGGTPAVVFGCARLTVSGRTVEFSAHHERTGGGKYGKYNLCLNPAYPGRSADSAYIPGTCVAEPVPKRPDVLDASPAVQGGPIRRYGLVIWGTTGIGTRQVTAGYGDEQAEGAVLPVERPILNSVAGERQFSVFIVELPMAASCGQVTVRASGAFGEATALVEPRLNLCERIE